MKRKVISVRAFEDEHFRNSYWRYDYIETTKKALSEFERRFRVRFQLAETGYWNSGNDDFLLPCNTEKAAIKAISGLPNNLSNEELLERIVKELNDSVLANMPLELPIELSDEGKEELREVLSDKSMARRLGYLQGLSERLIDDRKKNEFFKKLLDSVGRKGKEIIIGFTTKIFPLTRPGETGLSFAGCAYKEKMLVLVGFSFHSSYVLTHELGHIFGAKHVEDCKSSIMSIGGSRTYNFDRQNRKIISRAIKELRV